MIWPEIAVMPAVANGLICSRPPLQDLSLDPCTHCNPSTGDDAGVMVTTLTAISPVFGVVNQWARALVGCTVPENVSVWFCDGSTMPPQLTLIAAARASASAPEIRKPMPG